MKNIPLRTLLIAITLASGGEAVHAQLNIVPEAEGIVEIKAGDAPAYDSLYNVNSNNVRSQLGQTLFLKGDQLAKSIDGYVGSFYRKPVFHTTYETTRFTYHGPFTQKTPYNDVTGKYYIVTRILENRKGATDPCNYSYSLELTEKESGEKMYWLFSGNSDEDFINIGFYEKLKARSMGKTYRSLGTRVELLEEGGVMIPEKHKKFTCTDIGITLHKSGGVFLILQDKDGRKVKGETQFGILYDFE